MTNKKLHIVSFDVPYPPVYGGIIDVFFKIKALHNLGIDIYLHTYYDEINKSNELNKFCKTITYYKRNLSVSNVFSRTPFIVKSRFSNELLINLKAIKAPILFEGLHTTFPLIDNDFKDRKILIRTHNIEHYYYDGLSKSESSKRKKLFFKLESKKLERYESIVEKSNYILTISPFEYDYFKSKYRSKTIYLPVFHQNLEVSKLSQFGKYALYHGDLRVSDNIKSIHYIINIFSKLNHQLVIAGRLDDKILLEEISKHKNIKYIELKNDNHLSKLFENAHINILTTFQQTGIKLKLINALYNSRFCLVNDKMVLGTGLENLCETCNSISEFREIIITLFESAYTNEIREQRLKTLAQFNTNINAQLLNNLLN